MKCTDEWLRSWVNYSISLPELAEAFTQVGLEVGGIDNDVISLDITPNRGDCFSALGLAREAAAIYQLAHRPPEYTPVAPTIDDQIAVELQAPDACPRYLCRMIKGIRRDATTPKWLAIRLAACDIRTIHPVVDILNYVMLDVGQPMHAFDCDSIDQSIVVRYAKPKEFLTLLDEQAIHLTDDCLVIADKSKVLAFAGIMGGLDSGVTDNTTDILLESALFMPHKIAGKARQFGLHTDSQVRFERGVDPNLAREAMEYATQMILEICGGTPGPVQEAKDVHYFPKPKTVTLSYAALVAMLGNAFSPEMVAQTLTRLGCDVSALSLHDTPSPSWQVKVPSYRWDINEAVDLIEEVARLGGYDKIPATLPQMSAQFLPQSETAVSLKRFKRMWVDMGYQEVITYSFIDQKLQEKFFPGEPAVHLMNPISQEMGAMRLSLWPSLVSVLQFNQNRQKMQMRLFEVGKRYELKGEHYHETPLLSGLICGPAFTNTWRQKAPQSDYFLAKQHLEHIWALLGYREPLAFVPETTLSCCHPGQCANLYWNGKKIGVLGRLHPALEKACDVVGPVILFELILEDWLKTPLPQYQAASRFPEIRRDIAIVVDIDLLAGDILKFVRESAGDVVKQVNLFDVYIDENQLSGRKSLALGLILQHSSRTLVDKEADETIDKLLNGLKREFGATLRE